MQIVITAEDHQICQRGYYRSRYDCSKLTLSISAL